MVRNRSGSAVAVIGGLLGVVGAVVTIVYIFQPWRSCPYDDSPAACGMLPLDAAVMTAAMLATVAGVVLFVVGLAIRFRGSDRA